MNSPFSAFELLPGGYPYLVFRGRYPPCLFWVFSLGVTRTWYDSAVSGNRSMEIFRKRMRGRWKFWFSDHVWKRKAEPIVVGGVSREVHLEITLAVSELSTLFEKEDITTRKFFFHSGESLKFWNCVEAYLHFFSCLLSLASQFSPLFWVQYGSRYLFLSRMSEQWTYLSTSEQKLRCGTWLLWVAIHLWIIVITWMNNSRLVSYMTWTGRMTKSFMTPWMWPPCGIILVSFALLSFLKFWQSSSSEDTIPGPPCVHVPGSTKPSNLASPIQAITIHCPPRLPIPDGLYELLIISLTPDHVPSSSKELHFSTPWSRRTTRSLDQHRLH